jgi:glycosyltransferase involved in cell wall biosynthesis
MKIAIVSSYHRDCGVAQYVEHLESPLRELLGDNLDILPLPVDLLRSPGATAAAMAQQAMAEVLRRVRLADVVVIEFEPGLFGKTQGRIWATFKAVCTASRHVIITYHTAPAPAAALQPSLRSLKAFAVHSYRQQIFRRLLRMVRANQPKFAHIVQTGREKHRLVLLGIDPQRIKDMPLAFFNRSQKAELADTAHRAELDGILGTHGRTLLGAFGFLGGIKGTGVALKALSLLPPDHHLMIVGGIHPEGIVQGTSKQPALRDIAAELAPARRAKERPDADAARRALLDRVHFTGSVDNRRFSELMAACDAVLLPYEEVGQTSSGPASQALDLQRPIYCSRTGAFRELDKYAAGALSFFEIGNYFELAQKIVRNDASTPARRQAAARYADTMTVERRAQLYVDVARSLLG